MEDIKTIRASAFLAHNIAASKNYTVLDVRREKKAPRPLCAVAVDISTESIVNALKEDEKRVFFEHVVVLGDEQDVARVVEAVREFVASHKCVEKGVQRKLQIVVIADVSVWPEVLLWHGTGLDDSEQQLIKWERTSLPHKITSDIYLGDWMSATDLSILQSLNVKGIINASNHFANKFEDDLKYIAVNVDDCPSESISEHFDKAVTFKRRTGPVLVHCAMGVSRSASLVTAMLLHEGLTLKQAVTIVHSRRDVICPNQGFLEQLSELEARLRGSSAQEHLQLDDVLDYSCPSLQWSQGSVVQATTADGTTVSLE